MVKRVAIIFLAISMGIYTGCGNSEIEKNTVLEKIKNESKLTQQVKLEKPIENIKEVFKNESKDISFETQLSEYEFLVKVYNKDEVEMEKKVAGFGDTLYKFNIKTKEVSEYLKAEYEDYVINKVYVFDGKWVIWIESDVVVHAVNETIGGNYNIVCKNMENDETFLIENKKKNISRMPNEYMLINPQKISYSNGKVAYSYFEIVDGKYKRHYKTFDLEKKEGTLHFKGEDYLKTTMSEIDISNDMITFTESNYVDRYQYENGMNTSKLYYFNINEKPKVFKEFKEIWRLGDAIIGADKIYTTNMVYNPTETVNTNLVYDHNIKTKKSKKVINQEKFKDKVDPFGFWGGMSLLNNYLSLYSSIDDWILYDMKSDNFVNVYDNELFKDMTSLSIFNYDYNDYINVIAYEEGKDKEVEYLIKYK